jgi:hypothetical protein
MANKFVFNPFSGTFDIISPAKWDDLVCGIPDYIEGRPVVQELDGSLHTADLVLTFVGECKIENLAGDTVYSGNPYTP